MVTYTNDWGKEMEEKEYEKWLDEEYEKMLKRQIPLKVNSLRDDYTKAKIMRGREENFQLREGCEGNDLDFDVWDDEFGGTTVTVEKSDTMKESLIKAISKYFSVYDDIFYHESYVGCVIEDSLKI